MLTPDQIELIHREIDGENLPAESAAFRELVEREPEARALAADLRNVAALMSQVEDRAPPPRLRHAILNAKEQEARASPEHSSAWAAARAAARWAVVQWSSVTTRMEDSMLTKKGLIIGTTSVAVVAIVGALWVGYPPSGGEIGTIGGGGDTISGVQMAGRYRGRAMSASDVSIRNPQIQVLFQNHEILRLVQSNVFREAMRNDAFRELQASELFQQLQASEAFRELMASEAYRELMASAAYRELMASEAYHQLMASEAYRELMSTDAFRQLQSSEAFRELQANALFRELQSNDVFRQLMASDLFRQLMSNDLFRELMANDSFRQLMLNDSFRELMLNDSFRELMATDAFRQLHASEAFRSLSRSLAASEAFLTEASRAAQ